MGISGAEERGRTLMCGTGYQATWTLLGVQMARMWEEWDNGNNYCGSEVRGLPCVLVRSAKQERASVARRQQDPYTTDWLIWFFVFVCRWSEAASNSGFAGTRQVTWFWWSRQMLTKIRIRRWEIWRTGGRILKRSIQQEIHQPITLFIWRSKASFILLVVYLLKSRDFYCVPQ